MKIIDMLISSILKKGVIAELKNIDTNVQIPNSDIIAHISIEKVTITMMKDEKGAQSL